MPRIYTSAKQVICMQGVSGSGKSHLARRLVAEAHRDNRPGYIVSADTYFYALGGGKYKFDFNKLGAAHDVCFRDFMAHLTSLGNGLVVVDNTNTVAADLAPYMRAASAYGWDAKIIRVECDPLKAAARNDGRAPMSSVTSQAGNLERENFPRWWVVERVRAEGFTDSGSAR
jgi:predicted kinase